MPGDSSDHLTSERKCVDYFRAIKFSLLAQNHNSTGLTVVSITPLSTRCRRAVGESSCVYDHNVQDITAYVLAGGKSTRMGSDNGFVQFASRTLLDQLLELARGVATGGLIGVVR